MLLLLLANLLAAQGGFTLAGIVVDGSGAVIVGADLKVSGDRGSSWRAVSDGRGEFRVAGLPAGEYVVEVERAQFVRTVLATNLHTASRSDLRIVLQPSTVAEHVTVVGRDAPYAEPETTIAKLPVSRRRLPNSVSVLTREQMDDQHMVNTWDALSQITGVTAIANDATQSQFHARGAGLESQQDGIPSQMPLSGFQQYDMAIYERVEVLRGPAGLLHGSGAFSGTVNFVRRRPAAVRSASGQASIGRWNNRQVAADVSLPLAPSLRSLAVFTHSDRNFFYDRGSGRKWLGYGALEWTPGTATVVSVTAAHQQDRTPGFSGLPTYSDGGFLDVARSFNPYPDWNRTAWDTTDLGAEASHRFNSAWQVVGKFNRRRQGLFFRDGFPTGGVARATNTVSYTRREFDFDYTSNSADAYAVGRFKRGGGHEWLIGMNASHFETLSHGVNSSQDSTLTLTGIALANPPVVAEPAITYRTGSHNTTSQSGLYTMLRSTLGGRVTTVIGGRWTQFDARARSIAPATPTDWVPGAEADRVFTPYAGVVVDVTRDVSLYGSYSETFVPQTQQQVDGTVLDPRVGHQWEVGAKGEHLAKRLLTSVAVFDIRDRNRAYADPVNPGFFVPLGEVESKGWEAEVTGRIMSLWHLTAGYTWLDARHLVNATLSGQLLNLWYPEHSLKAWSTWRVTGGPLKDLNVGAGVQAYSETASGRDTVNASGAITVMARRQSAYAVASANLSYPIQRHLQFAAQVNNVFDRTYYTRLGPSTNTYHTFGEPRSVLVSLRWQSSALR